MGIAIMLVLIVGLCCAVYYAVDYYYFIHENFDDDAYLEDFTKFISDPRVINAIKSIKVEYTDDLC